MNLINPCGELKAYHQLHPCGMARALVRKKSSYYACVTSQRGDRDVVGPGVNSISVSLIHSDLRVNTVAVQPRGLWLNG